jgi:hypothetical protein
MTEREALRLLHLDEGCSRDQLRRAYLDMVKVWHPDRFQTDPKLRAKAERTLQSINDAYAFLQGGTPSSDTAAAASETARQQPAGDAPKVHHEYAASPPAAVPTRPTRHLSIAAGAGAVLGVVLAGAAIIRWNRAPEAAVIPTETPAVTQASPEPGDVELPAAPRRPRARPPVDTPRPDSGHDLLSARGRGSGQMSARNASTLDAVVILAGAAGTRGFFLRRGEQVTLLDIAPGSYDLRVMFGAAWTGRTFTQGGGFFQREEQVQIVSSSESAGGRPPLIVVDREGMRAVPAFELD